MRYIRLPKAAIVAALILAAMLSPASSWASPAARSLIGAIRWDAWIGPFDTTKVGCKDVGLVVERNLGPQQFHDRIPFYGKETGPNSVEARELTQDVMDREIRYAHDAGIDYWPMCWYPDGSGMDTARRLYLSSKIKSLMKYCMISGHMQRYEIPGFVTKYFKDPCYLKVFGNRPVIFLFGDDYSPEDFDFLCAQTRLAGLGKPYVVMSNFGKGVTHDAEAAFDGEMYSYWQATPGSYAGEWLEVDFGANTTFDKAIIAEKDGHTSGYDIRYWNSSQWLNACTGTMIGSGKSPTTVTFVPVTGSKARLFFLSGTKQPQVCEFQLYNSAISSSNLALGNKYDASSFGYHYEALSHYACGARDGAPFTKVMSNCEELWNRQKGTGLNVVPIVSAGVDSRPRQRPDCPWKVDPNNWALEPTPDQVGALVKQALTWIDSNPSADPARLMIIYAWNEFDEGGWICPTLLHGSDRLDAIRKVLDDYDKK